MIPSSSNKLVASRSFDLVAAPSREEAVSGINGAAGRCTVWGRGAWSRFAAVDGAVATGTIGVDHERGALLAGLALAYSIGSGTFDHPAPRSGDLRIWLLSPLSLLLAAFNMGPGRRRAGGPQ